MDGAEPDAPVVICVETEATVSGGIVTSLIVKPAPAPAADGSLLTVTPESAGWTYVGLEVLRLAAGVRADARDGRA